MGSYVFDTSALIAVIQKESGYFLAQDYVGKGIMMSSVNVMEVLTVLSRNKMPIDSAMNIVRLLVSEIVEMDFDYACEATEMKTRGDALNIPGGLSLGDAYCLAVGKVKNCPVVTADRVWQELHPTPEIILIR